MALSISTRVSSIRLRSWRSRSTLAFSRSHCSRSVPARACNPFSSSSIFSSRAREPGSLSFRSASRSISSWVRRRVISSSSAGIESISVRRRAAASSTRSIALSGRNRSEM